MDKKNRESKLVIVFVILLILINFPILSLSQVDAAMFSIPVKILFVFIVWFISIVITGVIINKK